MGSGIRAFCPASPKFPQYSQSEMRIQERPDARKDFVGPNISSACSQQPETNFWHPLRRNPSSKEGQTRIVLLSHKLFVINSLWSPSKSSYIVLLVQKLAPWRFEDQFLSALQVIQTFVIRFPIWDSSFPLSFAP